MPTFAVFFKQVDDLVDSLDWRVSATLGLPNLFRVPAALGDEILYLQHCGGGLDFCLPGSALREI
jgi:hypothetical protein